MTTPITEQSAAEIVSMLDAASMDTAHPEDAVRYLIRKYIVMRALLEEAHAIFSRIKMSGYTPDRIAGVLETTRII